MGGQFTPVALVSLLRRRVVSLTGFSRLSCKIAPPSYVDDRAILIDKTTNKILKIKT
jgi:hypothetical protein